MATLQDTVARLLRAEHPIASHRLIDFEEVVPGETIVALSDLQADTPDEYLWTTVIERSSEGWEPTNGSEAGDNSLLLIGDLVIASGTAPPHATSATVTLVGKDHTRPVSGRHYLVCATGTPAEVHRELALETTHPVVFR